MGGGSDWGPEDDVTVAVEEGRGGESEEMEGGGRDGFTYVVWTQDMPHYSN